MTQPNATSNTGGNIGSPCCSISEHAVMQQELQSLRTLVKQLVSEQQTLSKKYDSLDRSMSISHVYTTCTHTRTHAHTAHVHAHAQIRIQKYRHAQSHTPQKARTIAHTIIHTHAHTARMHNTHT